jgi:hypothetical protein
VRVGAALLEQHRAERAERIEDELRRALDLAVSPFERRA